RHGPAVVVLQYAICCQNIGVFVAVLFELYAFFELLKNELALSSLEGLLVQYLRVTTVFLNRPLLALCAELLPFYAFEERHNLRNFPEHGVRRIRRLGVSKTVHNLDEDLPVGLGLTDRIYDFLHPLDAALTIGEGAFLFKKRSPRKDDVGKL